MTTLLSLRVHHIDYKTLQNRICINLGRMGFSARLICKRTGFTEHQVRYRLAHAEVRLADYRNATSAVGDMVVVGTEQATRKRLDEMRLKLKSMLDSVK